MLRPQRIAFAVVAVIFLILVVVQVFLAGIGVFVRGVDSFSYHRGLGYLLPLIPIAVLLLALAARAGPTTGRLCGALLVLVIIQSILPALGSDAPVVAALHPVNALAIFYVALVVARRAVALARQPSPDVVGTVELVGETPQT